MLGRTQNGEDPWWDRGETVAVKPREEAAPWWRGPASIPRRATLYDGHYSRRAISASVGGGGRAKTTKAIYEAVSMASGMDLATREALPAGQLGVWVCNGEEDQDELDRRVAAVCQHYDVDRATLGKRLYVQSVRDNPLRIATLVRGVPLIDIAVRDFMIGFIERAAIDVFMLDPLVSFHAVSENDNGHMDKVVKEGFGAIANQTNTAGELLHHPGKPKPGQVETTVDDSRGASAVIWAVRSARVFNFMTQEEAARLGIADDERRLHVRISNGKANMGPLGKAKWIKLLVENLANGDQVAVASPFEPPDPFRGLTPADMELARSLAATGEYRADTRSPKWLGYALAAHLDLAVSHKGSSDPKDVSRLKTIIKTWIGNKALAVTERKDADGKQREFIIPGPFQPELPLGGDDE